MEEALFDLHQKDLIASHLTHSIYSKDDLESCDLDLPPELSSQRLFVKYTCRRTLSILGALPKRLLRAGSAILPSYLRSWNSGWQGPGKSQESHAISALDGLRGFACCAVFVYHSVTPYSHTFLYGYGGTEDRHFYQLPFLRLFFSGPTMVSIFFVISGCVLSYKPLKLTRTKSWGQLFHVVSSSVFRRGLRLIMPVLVSTFMTMLLVQGGLFQYVSRKIMENNDSSLGKYELKARRQETFMAQFCYWLGSTRDMTNPFTWEEFHNPYNGHLWTISVEFRSSMVLFLVIIALARVSTIIRLTLVMGLMFSCSVYCRWDVALFLSGMLLAELDRFSGNVDTSNQKPIEARESKWRRMDRLVPILVFIVGSYCASYPDRAGEKTPGYRLLSAITPHTYPIKEKWWQSIGSIMIVWSVTRSSDIQWLFMSAFTQYLGKISFAVYILHGPILHSVGLVAMTTSRKYIGRGTSTKECLGFFVAALLVLPTVFWSADVFWRLVDVPCTRFSKWAEEKFVSDSAGSEFASATGSKM
jgi:peptidoglycan/LPS O-acetylase OafA/YrhL